MPAAPRLEPGAAEERELDRKLACGRWGGRRVVAPVVTAHPPELGGEVKYDFTGAQIRSGIRSGRS